MSQFLNIPVKILTLSCSFHSNVIISFDAALVRCSTNESPLTLWSRLEYTLCCTSAGGGQVTKIFSKASSIAELILPVLGAAPVGSLEHPRPAHPQTPTSAVCSHRQAWRLRRRQGLLSGGRP